MPEESTTPDLAERLQGYAEAINAREFDGAASFFAHNAVYDPRGVVGVLEGRGAIGGFLEEWFGAYEEFEFKIDEIRDLDHGVAFVVFNQRGRLPGTIGWVQDRFAAVSTWADDLIQPATSYTDIDEAGAAAERLAEERG